MKKLLPIYVCGFFLAVHYASIAYINSSLLKSFTSDKNISILYIFGSILSISLLSLAPLLLQKFGNRWNLLFFIVLEIVAMFGLGKTDIAIFIFILFLIHQSAESLLYLILDINLEKEIKDEKTTGQKRGVFLTVQNIAWVISPLAVSYLIKNNNFDNVYYLSGIALIPMFVIGLFLFKKNTEHKIGHKNIFTAFKTLFHKKDEAKIIGIQFVLHLYFAWMLIYSPLMLHNEIGFDWEKIGIIFTIMLLPYILFELPTGFLADRKFGEKEILILGFISMALFTALIPLVDKPVFWIWAVLLFGTRIGASMVEMSSESYFFKHIKDKDSDLISLFRMARPFSFIIAPVLAMPVLYFTSYSNSFFFLAILTLSGLLFIPRKDTR